MADEELKTLIVDGRTGILHGLPPGSASPLRRGWNSTTNSGPRFTSRRREEDEAAGVEEAVKVASVAIPDMGEHDVMETAKAWKNSFPDPWKGTCRRLRFPDYPGT